MSELRKDLPPLPDHMSDLLVDERGYPIPFFVAWIDGKPDFRVADAAKRAACISRSLCWLCGERLGARRAFVIGPMCAVNRVSSEPPSHRACCDFAARACPFLVRPKAKRRETGLPEDTTVAGEMITRNPGVALLWVTKNERRFSDGAGGMLWDVGNPIETVWFAEGRAATREEVLHSIATGLPTLREMCAGREYDLAALAKATEVAMKLVPGASP